jgi:DNA polymerase III subunit epsilon
MDQFKAMVLRGNRVILDTETTGFPPRGEVVQLATLDARGHCEFDLLIKPQDAIPPNATRIHGITNEMVADSPTFPSVHRALSEYLHGKDLIVYNLDFDVTVLAHSMQRYTTDPMLKVLDVASYSCAMLWYADIWGEWDEYHHNNRRQKLTNACTQQGIPVSDEHSALGDCRLTRALILKLLANDLAGVDWLTS